MNTPLLNAKLSFNRKTNTANIATIGLLSLLLLGASPLSQAQTAPPPSIGEETKGEPAIAESQINVQSQNTEETSKVSKEEQAKVVKVSPLGSATIKESRRESGQVYRIELEHSGGAKQIIEENDSDGSLESTNNGIDDTPNLPKWTLGTW